MKNITLLASTLIAINCAIAQNQCGTTIEFFNVPPTLCSSSPSASTIGASPNGGFFYGAIVSPNGYLLSAGKPTGSYTVYYTAADSCNTTDSIQIEILETESEVFFTSDFDCASNLGNEVVLLSGSNEFATIYQGNEALSFVAGGDEESLILTSAETLVIEIEVNLNSSCFAEVEVPTVNSPFVQPELDYDCALSQVSLTYLDPGNIQGVYWQLYDNQPGDLQTPVVFGQYAPPISGEGRYFMDAIFDNGCRSAAYVDVPITTGITPRVSAGSTTILSCTDAPTDSVYFLGNEGPAHMSWSWSTADGSPFPGDSTSQTPKVPGIEATYALRTFNSISGCFSEPDFITIAREAGDTTDIVGAICSGEDFQINNDVFVESGIYQSIEIGPFGCENITNLELIVHPLPEVMLDITGPDRNGEYDVTAIEVGGQGYEYQWCNGATGNTVTGLTSPDCEVTITDPATGCTIVDNVNSGVSSAQKAIPGSFTLAPNPVSNVVNWTYTGNSTIVSTEVHSSTGQLIAKTSVNNALNQRLDLSTTPTGLYTITWIDNDGRMSTRRIVRQ